MDKVPCSIGFQEDLPIPPEIKEGPVHSAIQRHLQSQSIWLKWQLEQAVQKDSKGLSKNLFKSIIKSCAYDFKDGPWKQCYIRHGYDPRQERQAVAMQVLCIKTNRVDPKLAEI